MTQATDYTDVGGAAPAVPEALPDLQPVGPDIRIAPKPARNATIDGLKYVAAAGIVLHHVSAYAGGRLGAFLTAAPLSALFFFFAVAGYFHGELGDRGWSWLLRRLGRLAVPYAAWSVILLAWTRLGPFAVKGAPMPRLLDLAFLGGAHGILWTLPMLAYLAIVAELTVRTPLARRIVLAAGVAATIWIYLFGPFAAIAASPYANFFLAPRWLVVYVGGMELRAVSRRLRARSVPDRSNDDPSVPDRQAPRPLLWTLQAVGVASIVGVGWLRLVAGRFQPPTLHTTVETLLWWTTALLVIGAAAAGAKWFGASRLGWGRDYLIGTYITHVVWLQVFVALVPPGTIPRLAWVPAVWAATLAAATLTVWLLRTNRFTRSIVS